MSKLLFSDDHEYVRVEGDIATVGITDFAQKALGDVVYVELPKVGAILSAGIEAGVVESVKSANEVLTPLSGGVTEINPALSSEPGLVNQDPLGQGWFYKVKMTDASELARLKDEDAYNAYIQGL